MADPKPTCPHCGQRMPEPNTVGELQRRAAFVSHYVRTTRKPGGYERIETLPFTPNHANEARTELTSYGITRTRAQLLINHWNVLGRAHSDIQYDYKLTP